MSTNIGRRSSVASVSAARSVSRATADAGVPEGSEGSRSASCAEPPYGEFEAMLAIEDFRILRGALPGRAQVRDIAQANRPG